MNSAVANPVTNLAFRFKKGDSVGEPDAESDDGLLSTCFVDTGDYETLVDCAKPQCILVGRTGSGKSALLKTIASRNDRVIEILPENLSLQFISNSDILGVLEGAGVKLDIFYTLLWKHVLAVELLKFHFRLTTEEKTKNWLANLLPQLRSRDQSKERAIDYIKEWGDKFWQETEYRVKEITERLESDIAADIGVDTRALKTKVSGSLKTETTQMAEIINKAQSVVNKIQIKALSDVLRFLSDDVFNDPQVRTYVLIDKLDENWAPGPVRYRLIRALIETLKSFRSLTKVKIIVAMRRDLLETVFRETRDPGFQEEKYESLFLGVKWTRGQLRELLDKRVKSLVRARYTNASLGLSDIFPKKVAKLEFVDYLAERTLYRPRDAIAFVNECLSRSEGKQAITTAIIFQAENEYSAKRINALSFEWADHYPKLLDYFSIIERQPTSFKLSTLNSRVEQYALDHINEESGDPLDLASVVFINSQAHHAFLIALIKALYHVGVIGIKTDGFSQVRWAHADSVSPSDGQIKPNSMVFLHPMIWSRLGIIVN